MGTENQAPSSDSVGVKEKLSSWVSQASITVSGSGPLRLTRRCVGWGLWVVGGWRFSDLIHSPPFHWGARAASFVWIFWLPLIVYVALGLLSARGRALQGLGPPARRFTPVGTWLERRFLSWWFVALTTALGVFAGFLGATWEKSVSASTERNLQAISSFAGDADFEGMKNTVDGLGHLFHEEGRSQTTAVEDGERARWFYAFASLFAVSFGVTLWSQTRAADRASSEMDAQTRELGRAVARCDDGSSTV